MTNAAVAVREPTALETIKDQLDNNRSSIEQVLVAGLDYDRLKGVAIEAITRQPKLLQCTIPSLIRAIHQSAQLGLEPSGLLGSAYLVPYRNKRSGKLEAQLIVGYRGLVELADRTADIQIQADVVYPEDTFEYSKGTDPKVVHIPSLTADRVDDKQITHAYAVAFHPAWSRPKVVVMTRAEIERIQRRAKPGAESPWNTDWAAMARKTPIRQMGNQLPLRVQRLFDTVFAHEDRVEQTALPATSPERATRTAHVREQLAERVRERRSRNQSSGATAAEGDDASSPSEASGAAETGVGRATQRPRSAANKAGESGPQGIGTSDSPGEGAASTDGTPRPDAEAAPEPAVDFTKDEVDEILDGSYRAADEGPEPLWPDNQR